MMLSVGLKPPPKSPDSRRQQVDGQAYCSGRCAGLQDPVKTLWQQHGTTHVVLLPVAFCNTVPYCSYYTSWPLACNEIVLLNKKLALFFYYL